MQPRSTLGRIMLPLSSSVRRSVAIRGGGCCSNYISQVVGGTIAGHTYHNPSSIDKYSITANSSCHTIFGTTVRHFGAHSSFSEPVRKKSLITGNESVHSTMKVSKSWRNKPLFRRQGDVRFKTGTEAAQLLVKEATRRDGHETEFISAIESNIMCLSPIFDRNPKYAFVAKTLMEPDRHIQFRVAWRDDTGVIRMNRGYRIQYNNTIGSYCGALHFGSHITNGVLKSLGIDSVFANALVDGIGIGGAVGGADFNPLDKSEAELQRFCQSYMTELSKYIEPGVDTPTMGMGVGKEEMGYLFGHYKRINPKCNASAYAGGQAFLSGSFPEVRCPLFKFLIDFSCAYSILIFYFPRSFHITSNMHLFDCET
jgi:Glu/Leu/Phe/Val dehydrogenase, dimerisation domain